ncbi:hypothetical protein BQ8420_15115 [Nocardiopsis sp. JB363]|nr:hypothetical protein BQ8420_15115 [Nocardiopsis sp. JB363]
MCRSREGNRHGGPQQRPTRTRAPAPARGRLIPPLVLRCHRHSSHTKGRSGQSRTGLVPTPRFGVAVTFSCASSGLHARERLHGSDTRAEVTGSGSHDPRASPEVAPGPVRSVWRFVEVVCTAYPSQGMFYTSLLCGREEADGALATPPGRSKG